MRTGLYSCSQAHTVEVTCKQQKWRRGEEEDATKNTCAIFKIQDNHGKTEMRGTCHIFDKNLASTHGFFIEAPIVK